MTGLRWSPRTLLVTFAVAVGCGVLCGVMPAFLVARESHAHRQGGEVNRRLSGFSRPLSALVTFQIALSLVLLVAAGLLIRTLTALRGVALGFDSSHVAVGMIDPGSRDIPPAEQALVLRSLLDRLGENRAIERVGLSNVLPLSGEGDSMGVWIDDAADDEFYSASIQVVNGTFFETLEVPIRRGRVFTDHGGAETPLVLSEGLANHLWPGLDPIGRRLRFDPRGELSGIVVGIVADARSAELRSEPERMLYVSLFSAYAAGQAVSPIQIFVRSEAGAEVAIPAMRDAVAALPGGFPLTGVHTLDSQVEQAMATERFSAGAMIVAGMTGVLLAAIGLYGLLSFFVSRATPEIGIRMSLGASPLEVARFVLSRSILPLVIGVAGGLGAAATMTKFLRPFLFDVSAFDGFSFAGAVVVVVAVTLVASSIPARRAVKISPIDALRVE